MESFKYLGFRQLVTNYISLVCPSLEIHAGDAIRDTAQQHTHARRRSRQQRPGISRKARDRRPAQACRIDPPAKVLRRANLVSQMSPPVRKHVGPDNIKPQISPGGDWVRSCPLCKVETSQNKIIRPVKKNASFIIGITRSDRRCSECCAHVDARD